MCHVNETPDSMWQRVQEHLALHNTPDCLCASLLSALEHFKRWLIPEKVAISAEELEYLLRPSESKEPAESNPTQNGEDTEGETQSPEEEEDDAHSPEK